jgi:hypothetical protein
MGVATIAVSCSCSRHAGNSGQGGRNLTLILKNIYLDTRISEELVIYLSIINGILYPDVQ